MVTDTQRHTQTNAQGLQYTSPLSLVRSITNSVNYEEHRKSIEAVANYAAPLIGRVAYKEISGVARILCQGGHNSVFGVVKTPKIINVCRTTPGSTIYSRVRVIALGLCVIHIQ